MAKASDRSAAAREKPGSAGGRVPASAVAARRHHLAPSHQGPQPTGSLRESRPGDPGSGRTTRYCIPGDPPSRIPATLLPECPEASVSGKRSWSEARRWPPPGTQGLPPSAHRPPRPRAAPLRTPAEPPPPRPRSIARASHSHPQAGGI